MKALLNSKTTYLKKRISSCEYYENNYRFKYMDYYSDEDIECWCNIVNQAYEDEDYSFAHAREFLLHHPFCVDNRTSFLMQDDVPIATISYGKIRNSSNAGSFFRIAVLPSFQNRGIGKQLIRFAEYEMLKQGVTVIEESISLKRTSSFTMHFKCGYKPEVLSVQRTIRRPLKKEILLTICGYNLVINLITWNKYIKYKKRH